MALTLTGCSSIEPAAEETSADEVGTRANPAPAGTTHTTLDSYASIDSPLSDINELYPQAAGTGNVVVLVPSADVDAGLVTVSDMFGSTKFFVKQA